MGPSPISSFYEHKYFVLFVDDFSRHIQHYSLKWKSDIFQVFVNFQKLVELNFKLQSMSFNLILAGNIKSQLHFLKPRVFNIVGLVLMRMSKMGCRKGRFNMLSIPNLSYQLMLKSSSDFGTLPSPLSSTTLTVYQPKLMVTHQTLFLSSPDLSFLKVFWLHGFPFSSTTRTTLTNSLSIPLYVVSLVIVRII